MKFYSGVIDVGFIRSLYKVYFPDPFAKRDSLGSGKATVVWRSGSAEPRAVCIQACCSEVNIVC